MSGKQREKSITNNNATIKSIESAIECNLQLQTELARRLSMIAEKKASNRRLASRVTAQVVSTWNELDCLKTPPDVTSVPKKTSRNRKKNSDEPSNDSEKKYAGKKWKFDPYRKWTRRFFVDPEGSIPEPNDDIVKRRKLEEGKFFFHTCPPWSKKEEQTLVSIVTNMMKKCEKSFEDLEFGQVASALEERMKTVDKNSPATAKPRSGVECRLKYADAVKKTPFTKAQSIKILEQVHLHNGAPSWPEVAAGVDRSTWECLTTYMTKLSSSRGQPFTPAEDELLLKIVAAAGPQFVLNTGIAADLAARFFPDRSPKQVLSRLNGSLVNPNFAREVWSDEEERRLVLLMKVYRDTQFPITGAVTHFPDRANKAVSEKWDRSLNPEFSAKPFTPAEDTILLEAVRKSPDIGWTELSQLFTPPRNPRSLFHHFNKIATEEDLLLKYGTTMKKEGARHGLVKGDGLLSSDDFVVRAKKNSGE